MRKMMFLVIDRNIGEAMLGSAERLSEIYKKSGGAILYGANHYETLITDDGTKEIYSLKQGYNFYDANNGDIVVRHKHYSKRPEADETGYTERELKVMLYGEFGYDGLKAKKVLYPTYSSPDFPVELYEDLIDTDIVRRYRKEGDTWKEYYL